MPLPYVLAQRWDGGSLGWCTRYPGQRPASLPAAPIALTSFIQQNAAESADKQPVGIRGCMSQMLVVREALSIFVLGILQPAASYDSPVPSPLRVPIDACRE